MREEENKIYAPVIIPTLNRHEHLKRMVESLERNPVAVETEVFISVDYPPAEKYEEGHRQIVEFLTGREFGFKKLNIYLQDHNLGVSGNGKFLRDKVFERFDCYIFLEDDGDVAPNFLDYMDQGLACAKDRDDIYGVSAYSGHITIPSGVTGTTFLAKSLTWGSGRWRAADDKLHETATTEWFDETLDSYRNLWKILRTSKGLFSQVYGHFLKRRNPAFYADGELCQVDIVVETYLIFTDRYVILPTVSKIRNWGMDGSGVNCQNDDNELDVMKIQPLDTSDSFVFQLEQNPKLRRKLQYHLGHKSRGTCSELVAFLMFLHACFMKFKRDLKKGRKSGRKHG